MAKLRAAFKTTLSCAMLVYVYSVNLFAQDIAPAVLQKQWQAYWISPPKINPTGYGVYYFRKSFEMKSLPEKYIIHVSADNRYKLFINEKMVSVGPARGDLLHWNFETIDIASYLKIGKNIISAQVWNEGELRPEANITNRTAFILQGGGESEQKINTDDTWKCIQDTSYSPIKITMATFYVAGPGERVNMNNGLGAWKAVDYDDNNWQVASKIGFGFPKYKVGYARPNAWMLVPSSIPQMALTEQRFSTVRKAEGVAIPNSFPAKQTQIFVPANSTAKIILDNSVLTNAYPVLQFSGGKNSSIRLDYAEALFTKYPQKDNRNEIDGKIFIGRMDSLISNGNQGQEFISLSFRTYRYVQLTVQTKEDPLSIDDIKGIYTGYPFTLNAKIQSENQELQKILEIGWRTAQLCANETYMDCPYYEQLQYIGDTRIQALVSLYNSGDDRLVKNAINQFHNSQQVEGITQSRFPTTTNQYITPFSLWYIGMLHDYLMYGKDPDFVKSKLSSIRQILSYFENFQQTDGSLVNLPWWNFTDWVDVPNWQVGTRTAGKNGKSALMDLQLLYALQVAADIENKIGSNEFKNLYAQKALLLKKSIRVNYYDASKSLFADRSEKDLFSQHTNTLAILTETATTSESFKIAQHILKDSTLAPASIYFKYYVHQALNKAGLGNDYLNWLDKWRENMALGMTTWGETSDVEKTRSDCHAWGASPNIEIYRIMLGIDSEDLGFSKVKIEPHLDNIKNIGGEIPHPNGKISVQYQVKNNILTAKINLPSQINGRFIWNSKTYLLSGGMNSLKIPLK